MLSFLQKNFALLLAAVLCLSMTACGDGNGSGGEEDTTPTTINNLVTDTPIENDYSALMDIWSSIDSDTLYLYDVNSNEVKVSEEWSEDGSGGFWIPISDNVYAEFQDPDWIGAWSPEQYFGAKELKKGFKNGKIGFGSKFSWVIGEDGKISSMYEQNYYENNDVTGFEGGE